MRTCTSRSRILEQQKCYPRRVNKVCECPLPSTSQPSVPDQKHLLRNASNGIVFTVRDVLATPLLLYTLKPSRGRPWLPWWLCLKVWAVGAWSAGWRDARCHMHSWCSAAGVWGQWSPLLALCVGTVGCNGERALPCIPVPAVGPLCLPVSSV